MADGIKVANQLTTIRRGPGLFKVDSTVITKVFKSGREKQRGQTDVM